MPNAFSTFIRQYFAKITLSCFAILALTSLQAQDSNCLENFKTGKFEGISQKDKVDGYLIVRKKNKQIETFNHGESKIISKIKWQTDSTFTLKTLKHVNVNDGCDKVGATAYLKIIKCDEDICVMTWKQKGCGTGTATIRRTK